MQKIVFFPFSSWNSHPSKSLSIYSDEPHIVDGVLHYSSRKQKLTNNYVEQFCIISYTGCMLVPIALLKNHTTHNVEM